MKRRATIINRWVDRMTSFTLFGRDGSGWLVLRSSNADGESHSIFRTVEEAETWAKEEARQYHERNRLC